uniref:Cytochrome P450 n=1 Tax=Caenorhabditis japonica TaxID=281687 RepID=A0A8R1DXE9_CAEJA
MAFLIISSILLALVTFVIHVLISRIRFFKLRKRIGLDGPEPHWFLGNLKEIIERKRAIGYDNSNEWFRELHKKYGDKFGIYFGKQLTIAISNEEDIKEVFITNFSNFSDRIVAPIFQETQLITSLLQSSYKTGWKNCRSAIAPIFATGKMKAMHSTVTSKIDTFLSILEEKSEQGEKWDIYDDFQGLTLDVIGKCAFAVDSDCQRNRKEVFYVQARNFVNNIDIRHSPLISTSFILPELAWIWRSAYKYTALAAAEQPLVDGLSSVYERRRAGEGAESVDLLKLLLDRENDKQRPMSKREVIENCFAFLLAGYETTSTAMTYCTYLLSRHPTVQQKLYDEIHEAKMSTGLDYDSIHSLKYLDAVYKETLRVFPPVIQ